MVDRFYGPLIGFEMQLGERGEYVRHSDYASLEARCAELEKERDSFRRMCRENYDAFTAMRNDINEIVGDMRSQESALLDGPEMAHECAAVVDAIRAFTLRDRIEREPVVKALEWRGPDCDDEYSAFSIDKRYAILKPSDNGCRWLAGVGGYFSTVDDAQAAAQADHERRILSALASAPERVEVNTNLPERLWLGAGNDDNEHAVWFDPDEGGTLYVRADLASPPAPVVTEDQVKAAIREYLAAAHEPDAKVSLAGIRAALASREAAS